MTMLPAVLRIDREVKGVGDSDVALDLKICTANRDIMDCAVDTGVSERDRPGLSDLMTLVASVVHQHVPLIAEAAFELKLRTEHGFKAFKAG